MRYRNLHRPLLLLLAFSLWSLTPVRTAMADITYDVTVNTSSLAASSGYIDFQFNPANSSSLFATANLNNFSTDGVVGTQAFQPATRRAPRTGPLTTLSFDNGTATERADLQLYVRHGHFVRRDPFGDGAERGARPGPAPPSRSRFWTASGNAYSTGPGGAIVTIVVNPDGSTTGTAYSPSAGGGPTGTVTAAGTVPEPSTLVLGVIAFGALFGWHQVRRRAAA